MKKALSVILLLALLSGLLVVPAHAATSGYFTYFIQDGTARIEKCDPSASGDIVIPDTLGGYPVQGIHGYSFKGCTQLTGVTIPDTVTYIDEYAFNNCPNLTTVTIGKGVYAFGGKAFYECTGLEVINYNAVAARDKSEGSMVFYNAGQNGKGITVNIGKDVTRIPDSLFYGDYSIAPKIVQVNFAEDGVCRRIGSNAFSGCRGLNTITIPASVVTIESNAFYNCTGLEEINFNATAMSDVVTEKKIFDRAGIDGEGITVNIGKNVTKIPDGLFGVASSLKITKVVFEEGSVCTRIGNNAFRYANNLTQITLPESVHQIGDYAFADCTALTSISIPESVTRLGKGFLDDCDKLPKVSYEGATYRGTAENPYFMLTTGSDNFDGTKIHKDTKMIGRHAFYFNTGLSEIIFPDGLVYIGDEAFYDTDVTSVSIPDTVTNIGHSAFANCNLTYNIYDNGRYLGNAKNPYVVLHSAVSEDILQIDIHKDTKIIGNGALATRRNLAAVVIPEGVVTIGQSAFAECGLMAISIPDTVTDIGTFAFYRCSNLTMITVPKGVNRIKEHTFAESRALKTVILSEGVDYIEEKAFASCESLKTISVPVSLAGVDNYAFTFCSGLSDVYYGGTAVQRDGIFINDGNTSFEKATWHYNKTLNQNSSTGDLDGDGEISDWDGVLLARYLAGWNVEIDLAATDVDGDGEVTDWDGVVLDRYLAGWNVTIG